MKTGIHQMMMLAAAGLAVGLFAVAPVDAGKGKKGSNGWDSGTKVRVSKSKKSYNKSNSGRNDRGRDRGRSSNSRHRNDSRSHGNNRHSGRSHHDHDRHRSSFSISIGSGHRYGSHYRYRSNYCPPTYTYSSGWSSPSYYRYSTPSYRYGSSYSYSYPTTVNTYVATQPNTDYQVWQEQLQQDQATIQEPEYPAYNPGPETASAGAIARGEAEAAGTESLIEPRPSEVQQQLDDWNESGWHAIGRRNFTEARDHFARLAGNETERCRGKVGFAISSALLERESAAVWAMRRSFVTEPDALGYFSVNDDAMTVLNELAEDLTASVGQVPPSEAADRWFLVASIEYLTHDVDAASAAAAAARSAGDDSLSLRNLEQMLDPDAGVAVE